MKKQNKKVKSVDKKKKQSILIKNEINVQGNLTIASINKLHINTINNKEKSKEKENLNMIKESNKIISQLRNEFEQIKKRKNSKQKNIIYDNYIPALTEEDSKRIRSINSSILDSENEKNYLNFFQTKINSKRKSRNKKIKKEKVKENINITENIKKDILNSFEENDLNCINKQIAFSIQGINNENFNLLNNKIKELEKIINFLVFYINEQKIVFVNNIQNIVRKSIENILSFKKLNEKKKCDILIKENSNLKKLIINFYDSFKDFCEEENKNKLKEKEIISQLIKENEILRKIIYVKKNCIIDNIDEDKFDYLQKYIENKKKKRISEIEEEIRLLVQNDDKITKSTSLNKSN